MADEMLDHEAKELHKCILESHGNGTVVLYGGGQDKLQSIAPSENPKISAAIPLEVHVEGELDGKEDDLDGQFERAEDHTKGSKVSLPNLVRRHSSDSGGGEQGYPTIRGNHEINIPGIGKEDHETDSPESCSSQRSIGSHGTSSRFSHDSSTITSAGSSNSWLREPGIDALSGRDHVELGLSQASHTVCISNEVSKESVLRSPDLYLEGSSADDDETSSPSSASLSLRILSAEEDGLVTSVDPTFSIRPAVMASGSSSALISNSCVLDADLPKGHGRTFSGGVPAVDTLRARIFELSEELMHMDQRRRSLEGELKQQQARHESDVRQLEERWLEQVNTLQEAQKTLEAQRDDFGARLRVEKDMYKRLELSEALARELRRVPEDDLTLKEYVSLKAHDLVSSAKEDLERTRREVEKTREQLMATTEAAELQRREEARARRLWTAREEGLKVDVEALKERAEEMCGRAREAQRAADENKDKARRFDEVEAHLRTTRLELDAAQALAKSQAEALVDAAESEKMAVRNVQEATQRSAMLEMDKTYLQRELSEAQGRADRLAREGESLTERLRNMERAKEALAAELVSVREVTRSEHEERLESEIGRLREQSARELVEIRDRGRDMYERENKALREARTDALQECTRVRTELGELRRAHEDLVMGIAKSDADHKTALGDARSELRLKGFELSQLGVAHADKCAALRQAELELDMLREQVSVHRTEFTDLEASTTRKISELELQLAAKRDKVRAFEDLELEVDGAVLRAGRQMLREEERLNGRGSVRDNNASSFSLPGLVGVREALPGDGSQEKGVAGAEQDISGRNVVGVTAGFPLEEAMSLPIAPHRRLRQAVLLAQKLLRKEAELEATRRELTEVEERAKLLGARAASAEDLLQRVEQPTKYMVDSIRAKDEEIDSLRAAQGKLSAKLSALERACRKMNEEKESLEEELALREREQERKKNVDGPVTGIDAAPKGAMVPSKRIVRGEARAGSGTEDDLLGPASSANPADLSDLGRMPSSEVPLGSLGAAAVAAVSPGRLSEMLTVHEGRRIAADGPRWYSYRQSKLIRVPS